MSYCQNVQITDFDSDYIGDTSWSFVAWYSTPNCTCFLTYDRSMGQKGKYGTNSDRIVSAIRNVVEKMKSKCLGNTIVQQSWKRATMQEDPSDGGSGTLDGVCSPPRASQADELTCHLRPSQLLLQLLKHLLASMTHQPSMIPFQ